MSENPYQPPATGEASAGVPSSPQIHLLKVARYQRRLNYCILIQVIIFGIASWMGQKSEMPPVGSMILSMMNLGVLAVGGVTAMFLGWRIYQPPVGGGLLGALAFIPCLGLIPMLVINGKAATILEQNGVRVGLLGARDLSPLYDTTAEERVE